MSHQSKIQAKIRSISALKAACAAMGLEFLEQKTYRGYGSQTYQCDYAIRLQKSRYDIGVIRESDGSYRLSTDTWGGDVAREVGENCGSLMQGYGEHATREAAHRRGMSVYKTVETDGTIRLALRSYGSAV